MQIRDITTEDAPAVAALHIEGIRTGFISSLGIDFVAALYEAIAQSNSGFGFVAEENGKLGRQRVEQCYSIDKCVKCFLNELEEVWNRLENPDFKKKRKMNSKTR